MVTSRQPSGNFLLAIVAALLTLAVAGPVRADSLARSSDALEHASIKIFTGSPAATMSIGQLAGAGTQLVLDSVEMTATGVTLAFDAGLEGSRIVLTAAADALDAPALAVGDAVTVMSTAAGYVFQHDGRPIAFLPNELGRILAHSSLHEAER